MITALGDGPVLIIESSRSHLRVSALILVVKISHIDSSHHTIMPLKQPTYFSECTTHKTISFLCLSPAATLHIVITLCMYRLQTFCFNKIVSCSSPPHCENLFLKEIMVCRYPPYCDHFVYCLRESDSSIGDLVTHSLTESATF